jgi:hypothetical protein
MSLLSAAARVVGAAVKLSATATAIEAPNNFPWVGIIDIPLEVVFETGGVYPVSHF